jgi:hypothetical protein
MVFKTGDEDEFDGMTEAEFDALKPGDLVVHVHDAPDPQAVANEDINIESERQPRKVLQVGDHNPLAGGRVSVEVEGGTIARENIDKWAVLDQ